MNFKIIFLIISSNDKTYYDNFKTLQTLYLKNYYPIIKFFFLEFKPDLEQYIVEDGDFIYVQGNESINPGMIVKTCAAIKYINQNYNYDFIVRTNLSTVFHIPNLISYVNNMPSTNSCGGFYVTGFITGTGIILTRDAANKIADSFMHYNINSIHEDVLISSILRDHQVPYISNEYVWVLLIDDDTYDLPCLHLIKTNEQFREFNIPDNALHFRLKNGINRDIDLLNFKFILKKIYNITNT